MHLLCCHFYYYHYYHFHGLFQPFRIFHAPQTQICLDYLSAISVDDSMRDVAQYNSDQPTTDKPPFPEAA